MTYNVFGGTLSLTQSINQSALEYTNSEEITQNSLWRTLIVLPDHIPFTVPILIIIPLPSSPAKIMATPMINK